MQEGFDTPRLRLVRRARAARRHAVLSTTRYAVPGFNSPRGAAPTR